MKTGKKIKFSNTQVIILSFLVVILIGTLLLTLPISSADGKVTPVIDAMFTAATSVCVTGLVVVDTFSHWSVFGQVVILILIQCGGLGIVTFTAFVMVVIGKKVTLKDRMLLQDALNLETMKGLVKFMKKVLTGTIVVESIGALCYMFVFVPEYGPRGIWISIFNAVSAFCNAGIDIIGNSSLQPYATNVWVNIVTILLIIMGGIGFVVWWDILGIVEKLKKKDITSSHLFRKLSLHSKIVIITTLVLIFGGGTLIMLLEYGNPDTIGNMNFGHKIVASIFQAVTTRTAGFCTFSQKHMRDATTLLCIIMMFIGGSPVGTAGGIKTTAFALVILSARATVKGTEDVTVNRKTIPSKKVKKALGVITIAITVLFIMIMLLSIVNGGEFLDVFFEVTSAIATAGLSRDYTATLNLAGKAIIILCMFLGRVGPISLVIAFNFSKNKGIVMYPEEDITVG